MNKGLGLAADNNSYRFVGNNPASLSDPLGLEPGGVLIEGGKGLLQGGANVANSGTDIAVGFLNTPAALWNSTAGWILPNAPYIPAPDWSRGMWTNEDPRDRWISRTAGTVGLGAGLGAAGLRSLPALRRALSPAKTEKCPEPPNAATPNRPPSPNRVNPNVPAPQVPPDSLFGRPFESFGRDVIGWGTGAKGATERAQSITAQQLQQGGVTATQAQAARDFYAGVLARNSGNAAAAARVKLMDQILQLLSGG